MRFKDRPKSDNVVDNRNYFGTDALDPDYSLEDQQHDFIRETLRNPRADAPQKFSQPMIPAGLFENLPELSGGLSAGVLKSHLIGAPVQKRKRNISAP